MRWGKLTKFLVNIFYQQQLKLNTRKSMGKCRMSWSLKGQKKVDCGQTSALHLTLSLLCRFDHNEIPIMNHFNVNQLECLLVDQMSAWSVRGMENRNCAMLMHQANFFLMTNLLTSYHYNSIASHAIKRRQCLISVISCSSILSLLSITKQ